MKQGLIVPRNSIKNIWWGQDKFPAIYNKLSKYCTFWVDFREGTGPFVSDISETKAVGQCKNMTNVNWANAYKGGLDFDGSNDYVEYPDNDCFDIESCDFTIDCWIIPRTLSGSAYTDCVIEKMSTTNPYPGFAILVGWGRVLFARNGGNAAYTTINSIQANKLYHIVITKPTGDYTTNIYINGVDKTQTVASNADIKDNTFTAKLGRTIVWGSYFDGEIYMIRLLRNYCLTSDEIVNLYNYEQRYMPAP